MAVLNNLIVNGSARVLGDLYGVYFSGNAATASKATNDSDGNPINSTYLKKSGGTMTGKITLSTEGMEMPAAAGYYTDQFGNFHHKQSKATDCFHLDNYHSSGADGTKQLKYYWETGVLNLPSGGSYQINGTALSASDVGAVKFHGNLSSSIGSGTPAAATQTYWVDNVANNSVSMAYNTSGTEYSLLFSRGGSATYGSVLKWGYNDLYFYIMRKNNASSWKETDWVKMNAGYADSAGSATTAASCTGNAATATQLSSTPNNNTKFLRGDNTWSNYLLNTLFVDYIGSSGNVTSRLTSIDFSGNPGSLNAGRTKMRLDLVTSSITNNAPPGNHSSGYLHTYIWDNTGSFSAGTQLYIPNGDHITSTAGPQGLMMRGNDDGTWSDWVKIPTGTGWGASGTWEISITGSAGSVAWSNVSSKPDVPTNWLNGSATGSVRTSGSATEDSSYTIGQYAVAEGKSTFAEGRYSHAEGGYSQANSDYSHAEGHTTSANGESSHAEGNTSYANGNCSHAEGYTTRASGAYSHSEGNQAIANGNYSHAEGCSAQANGETSHAEGIDTYANGNCSHAEGYLTRANGNYSHAEGYLTHANGNYSHAEGYLSEANGQDSHAEGFETYANGLYSHAEGRDTHAEGYYSHAEGYGSYANGNYSHAEGYSTHADKVESHAEGIYSQANGLYSHAEGYLTRANGEASHTEGDQTYANGNASHAEGFGTHANGVYSHAGGYGTYANRKSQTVIGEYNISDTTGADSTVRGSYAFIVGNGTANDARSNAFTIDWNGNPMGKGMAGEIIMYGGSMSQTVSGGVVTVSGGPAGWLICDGSAISRTTYAALFAAIGTTWGTGDGSTTFNLPDLRGRAPIGAGTGTNLTTRNLGEKDGQETVTLGTNHIPAHTHGSSGTCTITSSGAHTHTFKTKDDYAGAGARKGIHSDSDGTWTGTAIMQSSGAHTHTVPNHTHTSVGGGQAHTNMQPSTVVHFIICTGVGYV